MQRWTISSTDRKGEDTRRTSLSSSSARMKRAAPPIVQTVPIRLSAISRLNTSRLALVRSSDSRNFLMPAAFSAMSGSGRLDFLFLRTTLRCHIPTRRLHSGAHPSCNTFPQTWGTYPRTPTSQWAG